MGLKFTGYALIIFILLLIFLAYLYKSHREIFDSPHLFILLALISFGVIYLCKVILSLNLGGALLPVSLAGMLITPLIGKEVSFTAIFFISLIVSFFKGFHLDFLIFSLIGGTVATLGSLYVRRRVDMVKVGGIVGIFNAVFLLGWGWIRSGSGGEIFRQSLWGLSNGIICSILSIGILPILEFLFGVVTEARLLELCDLNSPLLRDLRKEAPGTYQSSLIVASLAENAAEKVGANALLARVGAYYHDVGKLKNPLYFVENQTPQSKNIHERINPALSSLILTSHVKEGVNLAKKYRLPPPVVDIIKQHHGTTLTSFFYQKAKKNNQGENVREEDFRYPGPKPKSKEAAIVMLADAVEAASRSLEEPSPSRLRNLVEKVIKEKIEDGQLDEAPLTLGEIDQIKESFLQTLSGIYHSRIEYPEEKE